MAMAVVTTIGNSFGFACLHSFWFRPPRQMRKAKANKADTNSSGRANRQLEATPTCKVKVSKKICSKNFSKHFRNVFKKFFEFYLIDWQWHRKQRRRWRRRRRKDAKNGAKTIQNDPKTTWKSLESVAKFVRFRMGALLRIVLTLSD